MTEYEYENYTASEIGALEDYRAARREVNDYVDADADQVMPAFTCPACGEARADSLLIRADDERIACATCGAVYTVDCGAHHCHCGQPLDDGACERAHCAAEWQEYLTDSGGLADKMARIEKILNATPRSRGFKPGYRVFMLGAL